ncbi:SDR family NAD(P)-dependent oxidoreductase [Acinetobacter dispersus]|uniref:SDR family NAD(P)-dependent oxidoreductase n=1 Tax=Acinetobacter dispersus TaxID=70348 RepID=UPI00300B3D60
MKRIWFVTGTTRGMGVEIVKAAIQQGDSVIATGRSLSKLKAIYSNLPSDQIELVELDIRDEQQFATNVFGTSNVLRKVLPVMRQQRSGHIINTSSIAGVKAVANGVFYSASKFAVEAISLALLDEVAPFGIKVTAIEPGFFRTEFLSESSTEYGTQLHKDYEALGNTKALMSAADGQQQGSPAKLAQVVMQVAAMDNPPKQLLIGNDAIDYVMPTLTSHLDEIKQHETLTRSTDY